MRTKQSTSHCGFHLNLLSNHMQLVCRVGRQKSMSIPYGRMADQRFGLFRVGFFGVF